MYTYVYVLCALTYVCYCLQSLVEMGLYKFTVGHRNTMADFVHINNLIQAHRLAGEALLTPHSVAVSQEFKECEIKYLRMSTISGN